MSVTANPTRWVGVPFAYGGRGPDSFDCYGLVMAIHKDMGIDILDYDSPSDQEQIAALMATQLPLWKETPCAAGATVLFRIGRLVSHCGYMLDDDRMIHTMKSTGGVTIQRIDAWRHRIIGFYRYAG